MCADISLYKHQSEGLAWMQMREDGSTKKLCTGIGGILADDYGLGKTLTVLALIQLSKNKRLEANLGNAKAVNG